MSRTQYDCYASWGFDENPFQPSPLHPTKRDERLLVGRDVELAAVKSRLHKHGKITCVEGSVGIGKTSLVNIAAFQCLQAYVENEDNQLLIPCRESFQIIPDKTVDEFVTDVFRSIAQTLLEKADELRGISIDMANRSSLQAWLNAPEVKNIQMGLKAYVEFSTTTQMNNSTGFSASGFEKLVRDWLRTIFPAHGSGGVVCIIDNLELLETGIKARRKLESLRDRLFNTDGIRWVFCGANGIVSNVIASPRLNGYLSRPVIEVKSVSGEFVPELLERRIKEFKTYQERNEAYLPLLSSDLHELYWIINFNLRDLLAQADDFCTQIFEGGGVIPDNDKDKARRFRTWLERETTHQYQSLRKNISNDIWEILDTAMSENLKGEFGQGDFNFFKRNSYVSIEYSTFKRHLGKLEHHGIIARRVDDALDDEKKRTIYSVTSKGALVHYGRSTSKETHTLATTWLRRATRPTNS